MRRAPGEHDHVRVEQRERRRRRRARPRAGGRAARRAAAAAPQAASGEHQRRARAAATTHGAEARARAAARRTAPSATGSRCTGRCGRCPRSVVGVHTDATSPRKRAGSTCRSIFVSDVAQPGRCRSASAKQNAASASGTRGSRRPRERSGAASRWLWAGLASRIRAKLPGSAVAYSGGVRRGTGHHAGRTRALRSHPPPGAGVEPHPAPAPVRRRALDLRLHDPAEGRPVRRGPRPSGRAASDAGAGASTATSSGPMDPPIRT